MSDFYERLEDFKKSNKLNLNELGAYINKTGDAMRMALKRKSLSELEKNVFENLFVNKEKANTTDFDIIPAHEPKPPYKVEPLSKDQIKAMGDALRDNWNDLSKDESFRLIFTLRASQWVKRILKE